MTSDDKMNISVKPKPENLIVLFGLLGLLAACDQREERIERAIILKDAVIEQVEETLLPSPSGENNPTPNDSPET